MSQFPLLSAIVERDLGLEQRARAEYLRRRRQGKGAKSAHTYTVNAVRRLLMAQNPNLEWRDALEAAYNFASAAQDACEEPQLPLPIGV